MPWNPITQMEGFIRFAMFACSDRFTLTELRVQYSAFAGGKTLIGIIHKTDCRRLALCEADWPGQRPGLQQTGCSAPQREGPRPLGSTSDRLCVSVVQNIAMDCSSLRSLH